MAVACRLRDAGKCRSLKSSRRDPVRAQYEAGLPFFAHTCRRGDRALTALVGRHPILSCERVYRPFRRTCLFVVFPGASHRATFAMSLRDTHSEVPRSPGLDAMKVARYEAQGIAAHGTPTWRKCNGIPYSSFWLLTSDFDSPLSGTSYPVPPPRPPTSLRRRDAVSDAHATPLRKYRWLGPP